MHSVFNSKKIVYILSHDKKHYYSRVIIKTKHKNVIYQVYLTDNMEV